MVLTFIFLAVLAVVGLVIIFMLCLTITQKILNRYKGGE